MSAEKGCTRMAMRFIDAEFEALQYIHGQDLQGGRRAYERMTAARMTAMAWGYTPEQFEAEYKRMKRVIEEGL